jgi:replication factor A1
MKSEIELAPFIEDLSWALENNVEAAELEVELKKCIENFDLSIDEAKRAVLKKFGGDTQKLGNVTDKSISELTANENNVNLLCRIIYIDDKEITVDGKTRKISFGILGDTTGTIPFSAWHELSSEKGEVIRIYNGYTRSWRDKVQVHLGDRTHVRLMSPDSLPEDNHVGEPKLCKVKEFSDGLRNVETTVRVLEINEQLITIKGKSRQIYRGLLADETGKCRFAAWEDFELHKNDVINIRGGYTKPWRGVLELQLNGGATIKKAPDNELPSYEILIEDKVTPIRELKKNGGSGSTAVEGVVLDIRPTSGLVKRCPECNRIMQNEACMVHGKVEGRFDLRVKGVLDDGSGAVTLVLSKDITERILGLDLNGCMTRAKEHMRYDIIFEDLIEKLLARPVRVSGTVISDEFGLSMIGSKVEFITPKLRTEAISILEDLGVETNNEVWNNEQS